MDVTSASCHFTASLFVKTDVSAVKKCEIKVNGLINALQSDVFLRGVGKRRVARSQFE